MPISIDSTLRVSGELTTVREGGTASFDVSEGLVKNVSNGADIDQANAIHIDDFSIAASGTLAIDLAGALEDAHGNVTAFTAIKEILVVAAAANANDVVVGNSGVNAFLGPFGAAAHTVAVAPGNRFNATKYSAAGWPVVAGTGDILQLANGGGGTAVTGTITIIGLA